MYEGVRPRALVAGFVVTSFYCILWNYTGCTLSGGQHNKYADIPISFFDG